MLLTSAVDASHLRKRRTARSSSDWGARALAAVRDWLRAGQVETAARSRRPATERRMTIFRSFRPRRSRKCATSCAWHGRRETTRSSLLAASRRVPRRCDPDVGAWCSSTKVPASIPNCGTGVPKLHPVLWMTAPKSITRQDLVRGRTNPHARPGPEGSQRGEVRRSDVAFSARLIPSAYRLRFAFTDTTPGVEVCRSRPSNLVRILSRVDDMTRGRPSGRPLVVAGSRFRGTLGLPLAGYVRWLDAAR